MVSGNCVAVGNVDAGGIGEEVIVNGHQGGDGSAGQNCVFNSCDNRGNRRYGGTVAVIIFYFEFV